MLGWKVIDEMNVKKTREYAEARAMRKHKVTKYTIGKVSKLRAQPSALPIGCEKPDAEEVPWSNYFHSLCPSYYT